MFKKLFLAVCALTLVSCNFFEEMGDKTSDDARLETAIQHLNKEEYDLALEQFAEMSAGFLAKREVAVLYASAHGGACGLDFLRLLSTLQTLSSTNFLFPVLMKAFTGATAADVAHCVQAQDIIAGISSSPTSRTEDENLLMIFLSFAKMGTILASTADVDEDDAVDAGFDACSADLPDADAREIGSSMVHIYASISALEDASSIGDGQLTSITSLLGQIDSSPADFCDDTPDDSGNCTNTDPDDYSVAEVKVFRTLVNEDDSIGIGSCAVDGGDVVACVCL